MVLDLVHIPVHCEEVFLFSFLLILKRKKGKGKLKLSNLCRYIISFSKNSENITTVL